MFFHPLHNFDKNFPLENDSTEVCKKAYRRYKAEHKRIQLKA